MGLFFKTKEEKIKSLEKELKLYNEKYSSAINSFCMIGSYVFIFKGFIIKDEKIIVKFINKDTPKNYYSYYTLSNWEIRYDSFDFNKYRLDWIRHKESLEKLGLKITA